MIMTIDQILSEILVGTVSYTLKQLTETVENHYGYSGKKRGTNLAREIMRRVQTNPEFRISKNGNTVFVGLKMGRIGLRADFDLD